MKTMMDKYEMLLALLESGEAGDFCDLCGKMHLLPGAMNQTVLDERGITGEELVALYRL